MVVDTQATPGDGRWWSGRKSDQGFAGKALVLCLALSTTMTTR